MTINQLIKKLEKIRDKHGKRLTVMCAHETMRDFHNRTFSHGHIMDVKIELLNQADGDGHTEYNKDGSERIRAIVELS